MAILSRLRAAVIGHRITLPPTLLERFPELAAARYRRGGLMPRIGGWFLLAPRVDGITLGRTVWLATGIPLDAGLLLHELRHVQQFLATSAFPALYAWESLRRGYHANRYEVDARHYAAARLQTSHAPPRGGQ